MTGIIGTNKPCSSEHQKIWEESGSEERQVLCEHSLNNNFSGNSFKFSFIIKTGKKQTYNFVLVYSISKSWIAVCGSAVAAGDRKESVMLKHRRKWCKFSAMVSITYIYIYIKKLDAISIVCILLSFLALLHLYKCANFSSRTPDLYNLSQWVQSKQREIGN